MIVLWNILANCETPVFTDTQLYQLYNLGAHCFPVLRICATMFACFPFSLGIRILKVPPEIISSSILTMTPKGTRLVSWFFLQPVCAFYSTRSISTAFRPLASRNFLNAGQLSLHDSAIWWHSVSVMGLSPNSPGPVITILSMG